MRIDAHILCYNEQDMIAYTLRYYSSFCERIYLYDNMSTDMSMEIAKTFEKVASIVTFNTGGEINDSVYVDLKNKVWKGSQADFVIICDMDEYLYHPRLLTRLEELKAGNYSLPLVHGYNMYAEDFPVDFDGLLPDIIKRGARSTQFDKQIIFSPKDVKEINFVDGCHHFHPIGRLIQNEHDALSLLHFKYIGRNRVKDRYKMYASRLSDYNRKFEYGLEYEQGDAFVDSLFDSLREKSERLW